MAERQTITAECGNCGGTGLYRGFAEPEGVAVVCISCQGTGRVELTYTPFTKRKGKRDIHTGRLSRGSFIGTGVGPAGGSVTYKEFQDGKMPQ